MNPGTTTEELAKLKAEQSDLYSLDENQVERIQELQAKLMAALKVILQSLGIMFISSVLTND